MSYILKTSLTDSGEGDMQRRIVFSANQKECFLQSSLNISSYFLWVTSFLPTANAPRVPRILDAECLLFFRGVRQTLLTAITTNQIRNSRPWGKLAKLALALALFLCPPKPLKRPHRALIQLVIFMLTVKMCLHLWHMHEEVIAILNYKPLPALCHLCWLSILLREIHRRTSHTVQTRHTARQYKQNHVSITWITMSNDFLFL